MERYLNSPDKLLPACINCKHHRFEADYPKAHNCHHPHAYSETHSMNVVTGEQTTTKSYLFCSTMRAIDSDTFHCGTEGRLFEEAILPPDPITQPFLSKLWNSTLNLLGVRHD